MKRTILSILFATHSALAMDRFAALSMIESGDNDFARGKAGELSRFQIRRDVWTNITSQPISMATQPKAAEAVARTIAGKRCQAFEIQQHRSPTDLEFYILWNAPSQIGKPSRVVLERARRFSNLVAIK